MLIIRFVVGAAFLLLGVYALSQAVGRHVDDDGGRLANFFWGSVLLLAGFACWGW